MGGGVYFENTSPAGKKYTFNINLNNGEISKNISEKSGGGIYVYIGNVESEYEEGKTLTISGNEADEGAGIFIHKGNLTVADGTITGNTIYNTGHGAGIHIDSGSMTLKKGTNSSNDDSTISTRL